MIQIAANVAGFTGMACIIFAYWYITYREVPNPYIQHGVNLAGAALLTVSLLVNMNPASLALEAFWAAIAIWGLVKAAQKRSAPNPSGRREGTETCPTASVANRSGAGSGPTGSRNS